MPAPTAPIATAILLAAGESSRMGDLGSVAVLAGHARRKPFVMLEGRTVLEHCCEAFRRARRIEGCVLVVHPDDLDHVRELVAATPALANVHMVVPGGAERTDSVRAGLVAVPPSSPLVCVHDVARALVGPGLIDAAVELAAARGAALVAVPVTDTIKTSSDGEHSEGTLDRSVLWAAQTPQVFRADRFRKILAEAARDGVRPTDDAALWERYVGAVPILEGEATNLKLTRPSDLVVATALLRARRAGEPTEGPR